MSAEVGVDGRAATRRFLGTLYRSAPAGSLVEVRFSVAAGMGRRFHRVATMERVVDAVAGLASWTDAYVGVVPRRRKGGRRDDLVERASVLWVDCDSRESVAALMAFRPRPAIVIASGIIRSERARSHSRRAVGCWRRVADEVGHDSRGGRDGDR